MYLITYTLHETSNGMKENEENWSKMQPMCQTKKKNISVSNRIVRIKFKKLI